VLGENKIVVGRNQAENEKLQQMKVKRSFLFECLIAEPKPRTAGRLTEQAKRKAAELTCTLRQKKRECGSLLRQSKLTEK
jgi:hypothetical protein